MPHSKKHAQRLLRELSDDLQILLDHPSYRDERFLELYLEHCDEVLFFDPKAGLRLAEVAPQLAQSMPRRPGAKGRQRHEELVLRSYSILGSALRARGRFFEAEEAYRTARRLSRSKYVRAAERANFFHRLAVLRIDQRRFSKALKLVDDAIEIYEPLEHEHLPRALIKRGVVFNESGRFTEAVPCFGEALRLINPRRDPMAYHSAIHNLGYAFSDSKDPDVLKTALTYIREAKHRLRHHRRSLPKYKLVWLEGMLFVKVALVHHGERLLKNARQGFLELSAPFEIALVALDLSMVYRLEGRWPELDDLASDTYRRFRELSSDTESIAALSLWMDAIRRRDLPNRMINGIKETLDERSTYYPLPGTAKAKG